MNNQELENWGEVLAQFEKIHGGEKMKTTPGPWKVGVKHPTRIMNENNILIATTLDFDFEDSDQKEREIANAEFIVRACNAHDDLLEACRNAVEMVSWCETMKQRTDGNAVLNQLREAIKKAELLFREKGGEK